MTDDLNNKINQKHMAVNQDAYLAKKRFDSDKRTFEHLDPDGMVDDESSDIADLRHEIKLMMALFSESKFDDIVHMIANPSRLMGLNLLIGFIRGVGFSLAVIIMALIVLSSFSDTLF